jgi:hypothetical protein
LSTTYSFDRTSAEQFSAEARYGGTRKTRLYFAESATLKERKTNVPALLAADAAARMCGVGVTVSDRPLRPSVGGGL